MIAALTNHLWQSTLFAAMAGLLTLVLRNNHARVRYWLWLAASMKFLLPFAWLIRLGSHWGWRKVPAVATWPLMMEQFSQPFQPMKQAAMARVSTATLPSLGSAIPMLMLTAWCCGCAVVLFVCWMRWRRIAGVLRRAEPLREGREVEALRRLEQAPIDMVCSAAPGEPGVFGILRPVLFWPAGISLRLSDAQLEAILVHEMAHVRRRDNLTAAIHMLVEAVFWFHPVVWWIGARLLEERETACDDEVLRLQSEPEAYAEGILKVCEYCLDAPLLCVSGVSGADLKKRIQAIMAGGAARDLGWPRRLLLASAAAAAIAVPIGIGLWNAPASQAQTRSGAPTTAPLPQFEVASIKPAAPDQRGTFIRGGPGEKFNIANMPLKEIMILAWRVQPYQISGGPAWIASARYDISAKADHKPKPDEIPLMLQALLADRFQLKIHHETKELPIYALVLANKDGKFGPQLAESKAGGCTPSDPSDGSKPPPQPDFNKPSSLGCGGFMMGLDRLAASSVPIAELPPVLSRTLGRTVVDKTGLTGKYDISAHWTPDQAQLIQALPGGLAPPGEPAPQFDPNGPSIFTALQEQLGLKLESTKGRVDILVVDHVENPSEN